MPDIVDAATRSRMMSGIRGRNTRPELQVRSMLHNRGFRFRVHVKTLPGKPDIVLPRYRAIVEINGCFWHGHDCALFRWPGTRVDWWRDKIERNRSNDYRNREALVALEWRLATVWECALKGRERISPETVADALATWLRSGSVTPLEIRGEPHEAGSAH